MSCLWPQRARPWFSAFSSVGSLGVSALVGEDLLRLQGSVAASHSAACLVPSQQIPAWCRLATMLATRRARHRRPIVLDAAQEPWARQWRRRSNGGRGPDSGCACLLPIAQISSWTSWTTRRARWRRERRARRRRKTRRRQWRRTLQRAQAVPGRRERRRLQHRRTAERPKVTSHVQNPKLHRQDRRRTKSRQLQGLLARRAVTLTD